MLSDSAVQLALAARKAPLLSVEFAYQEQGRWVPGVRASDPAIGQFVHRQLQRLWKRGIARLLDSAQIWGWGAGEVTFRRTHDAQLEVDQILVRSHEDVRPVVQDGTIIGVEFRRLQKSQSSGQGKDKISLAFPRAMWHAHHPQAGQWFGWTVLAAAFSPWWDKHGSGGALDVRRLFMTKDGYRGTRIYYPSGTSTVQQPDGSIKQVPNHEIAMQIVETIRTGGVFALPSEVDANGTPRWKVEESQVSNNPSHILQYPKELDAEILNAMGIADDVLKSEATGSWAGKAVPQQATYCILEQWLSDLICDVDRVIERLVEINFGPGHQYEITTRPLADQMLAQQNGGRASQSVEDQGPSANDPSNESGPHSANRMGLDECLSYQEADVPWLRMAHHNLHAPVGGIDIGGKKFEGGWFIPKAGSNQQDLYVQQPRSGEESSNEESPAKESEAKNDEATATRPKRLILVTRDEISQLGLKPNPFAYEKEILDRVYAGDSIAIGNRLKDVFGKVAELYGLDPSTISATPVDASQGVHSNRLLILKDANGKSAVLRELRLRLADNSFKIVGYDAMTPAQLKNELELQGVAWEGFKAISTLLAGVPGGGMVEPVGGGRLGRKGLRIDVDADEPIALDAPSTAKTPGQQPKPKNPVPDSQPNTAASRVADRVYPTGQRGGKPTGRRTQMGRDVDSETKRALTRENDSADILANEGYRTEQNPHVPGQRTNPDYRIEGHLFDNYAPNRANARGIVDEINHKVAHQCRRIVLNLRDSDVQRHQLRQALRNYGSPDLEEIILIDKNGTIVRFFP